MGKTPIRTKLPKRVAEKMGYDPDDMPLSVAEQHFLANYIKTGNALEAVRRTPEFSEVVKDGKAANCAYKLLDQANIQRELSRIMAEARQETLATAEEVLQYFTSVMRGEVKDQFGLDAPLSERTRAAQELAKRTVDIENRRNGESDQRIEIKLDWSR